MPAPAVYVLAVVGTIGAAFVFHHFVYEPHLAPKFEQWAEEFVARRRAKRMQRQQELVAVPASIPMRRRRGKRRSGSTHSDSEEDSSNDNAHSGTSSNLDESTGIRRNHVIEVSQRRNNIELTQSVSGLRHRTNINAHVMDESITPIPQPPMSPTPVVIDSLTFAASTSATAAQRRAPSPSSLVSSSKASASGSTLDAPVPAVALKSATLAPEGSSTNPVVPISAASYPSPTSPAPLDRAAAPLSPPSFSSPIPSLSQSYPQELDREQGVELLSPPSSGTSSPFTTFSPYAASRTLSPFAAVHSIDNTLSPPSESRTVPADRPVSPAQQTATNMSESIYQSFPSSPVAHARSPVLRDELSYLSSPSPVNFTSPDALSPRSELSEFDIESDIEVISDPGSDDGSWAGFSATSGHSGRP